MEILSLQSSLESLFQAIIPLFEPPFNSKRRVFFAALVTKSNKPTQQTAPSQDLSKKILLSL